MVNFIRRERLGSGFQENACWCVCYNGRNREWKFIQGYNEKP